MIHRDNRHGYEASSALNQIIHREGPKQLTVGDVDSYALKFVGPRACLRLIEHKQPEQALKRMQQQALGLFDQCIRHAAEHALFGVAPGSGVYLMRGPLGASTEGRRKVDFTGPQTVETLSGNAVLRPRSRWELWDWLCCGTPWQARNERW
jgi:hypothetical protein